MSASTTSASGPVGQILIADDEDGLRWVLEKGFRSAGYQVTAVKDGTAALREVEAAPFVPSWSARASTTF